jgi:segregation and condensation protein A
VSEAAFAGDSYGDGPTWTVHTDVFEGPLDLLLHLVRRDGIDLLRLPVAQIANAYLEYLDHLRELNLSVAGEYLVMAATLVHLKSLEILPRAPTPIEEDATDPREDFARALRDYQRVKLAADALTERPWLGRDQWARPAQEAGEPGMDAAMDAFGLLDLYRGLLARRDAPAPQVQFSDAGPDLGGVVMGLLRALWETGGQGELTHLLERAPTRAARVVMFIGTLEMARLGWVETPSARPTSERSR